MYTVVGRSRTVLGTWFHHAHVASEIPAIPLLNVAYLADEFAPTARVREQGYHVPTPRCDALHYVTPPPVISEFGRWRPLIDESTNEIVGYYDPHHHAVAFRRALQGYPHYQTWLSAVASRLGWPRVPAGPILIGADPEWEWWCPHRGYVVVPNAAESQVRTADGEVGLDGGLGVVEARPHPTTDPHDLYARIVALIRAWERRTGARACFAGHRYAVGCHVHVGAPDGCWLSGPGWADYIAQVDRAVGRTLLLSGAARRGYRRRRSWRNQPHGVEYRTPPAAILAFEPVATHVFATALAIARGDQVPTWRGKALRAYKDLRDLVQSKVNFGLDGTVLVPGGALVRLSDFSEFHDAWRTAVSDLRVRTPLYLYGLRADGLTTDPELAQHFGWAVIEPTSYARANAGGAYAVGLPPSVRSVPPEPALLAVLATITGRR